MTENALRERLEDGEPSLATRLVSPWPGAVEVVGQIEAIDYVEFAAEYAPWDLHDLDDIARAAELAGLSSMIKIDGENRRFIAQRALAAGFENVLFADVRTVEDAESAVSAVRAEPGGDNGVRMDRRNGYVGGYASAGEVVEFCNDAVIAVMVEKAETVENLDAILGVEGIDMVQFGPADYALSLGMPGETDHPEVREAEERTIEAALDAGVAPRAEIRRPDDAERYLDMGVRDFSLGTDVRIVHRFLREQGGALADQLSDFER